MVASLDMVYGHNTQYIQFTITYYKILNQFNKAMIFFKPILIELRSYNEIK